MSRKNDKRELNSSYTNSTKLVLLITAWIITCYVATCKRRADRSHRYRRWISAVAFFYIDLEYLLGNLVTYLILSVPIILFLPFYVQFFTFLLCSLFGISALTLVYLACCNYTGCVEGVKGVFGAFTIAAYALSSYNLYKSRDMKLGCGSLMPILLIIFLL